MSLSASTLSAIQKVGAAAFTADEKLKAAVKKYAERVNDALITNPYGLGNNTLFETWKVVARLSQTMAGIEEELKKVYLVASELAADDHPDGVQVLSLAAPVPSVAAKADKRDVTPTDVRVKSKKKSLPPKVAKAKVKVTAAKREVNSSTPLVVTGNALKLMQHLQGVLSANEFTALNQTAVASATGIPMGSMTAALKKLIAGGHLIAGPSGSFQMVASQPASAS
jgi:hypothetical protein